ncbi:MAG TPA: tetratricopeptide repeat protein, partial [Stellaceae bacterium]|nr:tetratricopeptide repeat protein [Stellaceae bacterium]
QAAALAGTGRGRDAQSGAALRAWGAALAAERRFAEGARVLRRALERDTGEPAARDLLQLGTLYVRQRRFAEALPLIERAALADQTRLGPAHPFIADDFHALGLAYLGLRRPAAATAALRFAVRLLRRGAGKGTPRLAYAELTLARALHEEGREQEAKALFDAARPILGKAEEEERRRERRT